MFIKKKKNNTHMKAIHPKWVQKFMVVKQEEHVWSLNGSDYKASGLKLKCAFCLVGKNRLTDDYIHMLNYCSSDISQ